MNRPLAFGIPFLSFFDDVKIIVFFTLRQKQFETIRGFIGA
jgi:hypothetical protein